MGGHIDVWETEHRNFARLLDVLEGQLALFHEGAEPNYELMLDIMEYMISYSDRVHHPKEDLVFAKVAERDPAVGNAIGELSHQHQEMAVNGKHLHDRLENLLGGKILARRAIEEPARAYIDAFRTHMETEHQKIFSAVRNTFRREDWDAIDAQAGVTPADPLFDQRLEQQYAAIRRAIADDRA